MWYTDILVLYKRKTYLPDILKETTAFRPTILSHFSAVVDNSHRSIRTVNIHEYVMLTGIFHHPKWWVGFCPSTGLAIQKHKVPTKFQPMMVLTNHQWWYQAQGAPPVPPVVVINGGCVGRSQQNDGKKQTQPQHQRTYDQVKHHPTRLFTGESGDFFSGQWPVVFITYMINYVHIFI